MHWSQLQAIFKKPAAKSCSWSPAWRHSRLWVNLTYRLPFGFLVSLWRSKGLIAFQSVCPEAHMIKEELPISYFVSLGILPFNRQSFGISVILLNSSLWLKWSLSSFLFRPMDWTFMETESTTIRVIIWRLHWPSLRQKYPGRIAYEWLAVHSHEWH